MATQVAVILSGCGFMDGSEIHESICTLLALDRAGAEYQCFAPNISQKRVVDHLTKSEVPQESRNILVEAARIARGNIRDIKSADSDQFAATIFPGGFGAATNLCDFASEGAHCVIQPDVLVFAKAMADAKKPQGFICIAPVFISKIYGPGVEHTIGTDAETAKKIVAMGGKHVDCRATDIVIDHKHKVVSTPAYMLAKRISEVETGITKLVQTILTMTI